MSYNTSQQESMRLISYLLIFERNPKLPIREVTLSKSNILKRVIELIYKVPIFRESAKITLNRA